MEMEMEEVEQALGQASVDGGSLVRFGLSIGQRPTRRISTSTDCSRFIFLKHLTHSVSRLHLDAAMAPSSSGTSITYMPAQLAPCREVCAERPVICQPAMYSKACTCWPATARYTTLLFQVALPVAPRRSRGWLFFASPGV